MIVSNSGWTQGECEQSLSALVALGALSMVGHAACTTKARLLIYHEAPLLTPGANLLYNCYYYTTTVTIAITTYCMATINCHGYCHATYCCYYHCYYTYNLSLLLLQLLPRVASVLCSNRLLQPDCSYSVIL